MRAFLAFLLALAFAAPAAAQLPMGVPDFAAAPTKTSVKDGAWEDSATWGGAVPTAADIVKVAHAVTVTDATAGVIGVTGSLGLQRGAQLSVGTLLVYEQGTLAIGSQQAPGAAVVTFLDRPLDPTRDPEQFGTGLIAFGRVRIHGDPVTTPFARVNTPILAGASTLVFATAPGWHAGDRVVIPDTRQLPFGAREPATYQPQWEERTVASVSGASVTLNAPLSFAHPGAEQYLPHVANLTRSVRFRSERPAGTRAHAIFIHRADVDVRYAAFEDMGRTTDAPLDSTAGSHIGTNQIGRYSFHLHHVAGPTNTGGAPQFTAEGNAFVRSFKWPVAIHNSHFGLIRGNVVYDWLGAGIVTEDGSETQNVIERNFALVGRGIGGRQGDGREGIGFWFKGTDNYVRDNVAASIRSTDGGVDSAYGFKYYPYRLGTVARPVAPGSLTTVQQDGNATPIREFARNEVYGATESGLTFWWVGSWGNQALPNAGFSTIKDLTVWNVYNKGIFVYESSRITVDGLTVTGTRVDGNGVEFGDYLAVDFTLTRSRIRNRIGAITGTPDTDGTTVRVSDVEFFNNHHNVSIGTTTTVSAWATPLSPRRWLFTNVTGAPVQHELPYPSGHVVLTYQERPTSGPTLLDEIIYNGERVFYEEAAPEAIVPVTTYNGPEPNVIGAPVAGLTNAQAYAQFGVAVGGLPATCTTRRAGFVRAFVCPLAPVAVPPAPAVDLIIR